jgi:hypothetical protein
MMINQRALLLTLASKLDDAEHDQRQNDQSEDQPDVHVALT